MSASSEVEVEDRLRRTYRAVAARTVVDARPAPGAGRTVVRLVPPPPRRRGLRVAAALLVVAGLAAAVAGLGVGRHPGDQAATRADGGRWEQLPDPPIRLDDGAVWTGREAIAFGGGPRADKAAAYDPATRTWRRLPDLPPAAVGVAVRAVWTGHEVVAFPIQEKRTPAAAYDPATNAWRMLPGTYPTVWLGTTLAWTGDRVLLAEVGPERDVLNAQARALHAGLLDPATGRWEALPDSPAVFIGATASVWTGHRLVAIGQAVGAPPTTMVLDPRDRAWHDAPPAPIGQRTDPVVAWTGAEVLFAGGETGRDPTPSREAAGFDPATRTWHRVPAPPVAVGSTLAPAVRVGGSIYVNGTGGHRPLLLDTATGTWAFAAPRPPALDRRGAPGAAFGMGDDVLVLSSDAPPFAYHPPGG